EQEPQAQELPGQLTEGAPARRPFDSSSAGTCLGCAVSFSEERENETPIPLTAPHSAEAVDSEAVDTIGCDRRERLLDIRISGAARTATRACRRKCTRR